LPITGAYKRQLEIIDELEIVIDDNIQNIENKLTSIPDFELAEKNDTTF
jgi:hypothetical protein